MSAGATTAAPLCKDLKGLFTPCPKELNKAAAERLETRSARYKKRATRAEPDAQASMIGAQPAPPPTHLPFVAGVTASDSGRHSRPKLCKDLKGLFTPCLK